MKNLISLYVSIGVIIVVVASGSIFVINTSSRANAARKSVQIVSNNKETPIHLKSVAIQELLAKAGDPIPKKNEIGVRVPVLMYHHIRPMEESTKKEQKYTVTPDNFRAQLQSFIKAGYTPITPFDLERALKEGSSVLPSKPVLITIDDGYHDQYVNALPILRSLDVKATFFIVSKATLKGSMTNTEVQEIDADPHVTIASHSRTHVFLGRVSAQRVKDEIENSRSDLQNLLHHEINYFAYPYGSLNPSVEREVKNAGYHLGFGVRLGSLQTPSVMFELRRILVTNELNIVDVLDAFREI